MERRGARRIEYSCEVECEGPWPDPVRPRMLDLSATGAFIESSTRPHEGVRLMLLFALPSGEISVAAEVARVTATGIGIRFVELTQGQMAAIDAAVAAVGPETDA
ncbi:MAG: PilZ domain-containing protein [Vicinamibacteria bacterium]